MTKIRLLSLSAVFMLIFTMVPLAAFAEETETVGVVDTTTTDDQTEEAASDDETTEVSTYEDYLDDNEEITYADIQNEITVADKESGLASDNTLAVDFTVNETGYYNLEFQYIYTVQANKVGKASILVDGKLPFKEADKVSLSRLWVNKKEIEPDEQGNDISPDQVELSEWQTYVFKDRDGLYSDPLVIYLTEGTHTLTIAVDTAAIKFKNILLKSATRLPSYEKYIGENSDVEKYTGDPLVIQGEDAKFKSEMYLIAQNDITSAVTTPASPDSIKLNTFGGQNWKLSHETATWVVTAPEAGLYKLNLRYRQNYNDGVRSYRRLYVNDEVPFQEADALAFQYADEWQSVFIGDYFIKLKKGENTIALECVLGKSAEILSLLEKAVFDLNDVYRQIIMVTGTVPDNNRDYSLEVQIPGLLDKLAKISKNMGKIADLIQADYGKNSTLIAQMRNAIRQLDDMKANPENISKADRLSAFKDSIAATGSWITIFREQPLLIDAFALTGEDAKPLPAKTTFGQEVSYRYKRFVASFVKDYTSMGSTQGGDRAINVWLPSGRDQANVMKQLITSSFTPSTGISVNLSLVTGSIIEATLAGKGPDVALSRGDTDAVNFAMRDALYDISTFSDFNALKGNFTEGAFTPFQYNGGCYAVPETMAFNMMFCRTDILTQLGLQPPKTWDDMINFVYPVVSRNNMEIGIGNVTDIQAMNGSNIFTNLLYQMGGQIYADDLTKTALDTQVAYDAFTKAVDMYTDYKLPQAYDAMTRFRNGEMPIQIAPYTNYNLYSITVPELEGLWEMYPIPGELKEDGSIDISQAAVQSSAMMFKGAKDAEACWEFLKWWVSSPTQTSYGMKIEAILGPAGRYNTANLEAMSDLPWESSQLNAMSTQIDSCVFVPQLPGSYFTSRAINNAFMTCVLKGKNAKELLLSWNKQINLELERKRMEFSNN